MSGTPGTSDTATLTNGTGRLKAEDRKLLYIIQLESNGGEMAMCDFEKRGNEI